MAYTAKCIDKQGGLPKPQTFLSCVMVFLYFSQVCGLTTSSLCEWTSLPHSSSWSGWGNVCFCQTLCEATYKVCTCNNKCPLINVTGHVLDFLHCKINLAVKRHSSCFKFERRRLNLNTAKMIKRHCSCREDC